MNLKSNKAELAPSGPLPQRSRPRFMCDEALNYSPVMKQAPVHRASECQAMEGLRNIPTSRRSGGHSLYAEC